MDGVGVGQLPDANLYNDLGTNTLQNIAKAVDGLKLDNFQKLGLGNIISIKGVPPADNPWAFYGKMAEKSVGKDSTTGHWEIAGIENKKKFHVFTDGFPKEMLQLFLEETRLKGVLGNKAASGTVIINELGDQHFNTGYPIVYTSADSVFQIAAHENVIPHEELYKICEIARKKVCTNQFNVCRVIARPFEGTSKNYKRNFYRKDFSVPPPADTIYTYLVENKIRSISIGKIAELFNHKNIDIEIKTNSNKEGLIATEKYMQEFDNSFIFTNLVDFDIHYGHRLDPFGFAEALKETDAFLPRLIDKLDDSDILIITADHGNDPTVKSTDHSREYVPLLVYNKKSKKIITNKSLGVLKTFADIGQTAAHYFGLNNFLKGKSFLKKIFS